MSMRVSTINCFPVKSMASPPVASATLTADGIDGDRVWALRDVESGKLVSAKRPRLWRTMLDCVAETTADGVRVTLPSGASFAIDDTGLSGALSELLGRDVTIEAATGPMQGTYASDWPEIEGITLQGELEFATNLFGDGSSFVDVATMHIITTASLRALQEAAPAADLDQRRFRPSLVIDTPHEVGFVENEWEGRVLHIGEAEITVGTPAPRCIMTTVGQADLSADPGILRAIAASNRQTNDFGTFACLGVYASVTTPGVVTVDASVV